MVARGRSAVEEAQGGIRHIQQRYGTARGAMAFWRGTTGIERGLTPT
jgi:hypothetical protein